MLLAVLSFVCDSLWRIGWLALKLVLYMAAALGIMRLIAMGLS